MDDPPYILTEYNAETKEEKKTPFDSESAVMAAFKEKIETKENKSLYYWASYAMPVYGPNGRRITYMPLTDPE